MHIADHIVAKETSHALYALTDNCRTQMSYMKRFCHIGTAKVYDNGLFLFRFSQTQLLICCHTVHIVS